MESDNWYLPQQVSNKETATKVKSKALERLDEKFQMPNNRKHMTKGRSKVMVFEIENRLYFSYG